MDRRKFFGAAAGVAGACLLPRRVAWGAAPADLPAIGLDGREVVLRGRDVADFRAALRGQVLAAGDGGYDAARRIWNGIFDQHPALIARCADAGDVARAVDFARTHGLLLAVRGGGHSLSGQSVCEGGLMLDLSAMRAVLVDAAKRVAHVEGGALLGELDRATQQHGLATPAGRISHTGVAGLTLGGGFGRLTRRFGLACDNLLAAEVVTADGSLVLAGESGNPELLWGLQGGGGNFGVVTRFQFRLHPVEPGMYGGAIAWPLREARRVLGFYAGFLEDVPDELFIDAMLASLPEAGPVVLFSVCCTCPPSRAEDLLKPLRQQGKPLLDALGPATYVALQSANDADSAPGRGNYERSGFLTSISPALLDAAVAAMQAPRPPGARMIFSGECGGAFSRVPAGATAFYNRDARSTIIVQAQWPDPRDTAAADAHLQWARSTWESIAPHTRGFYVNTVAADDPAQRIRATYGDNHPRLVALKRRYDPGNLFRRNANIPPV
jgi:FAD/FMN-containing dehydrogenase